MICGQPCAVKQQTRDAEESLSEYEDMQVDIPKIEIGQDVFPASFPFLFFEITCLGVRSKSVQLRPTHVVFWVGRERNMQSVWNLGLALCCLWQPRAVPLLEVLYLFSPRFCKAFLYIHTPIFIAIKMQFLVQRSMFMQRALLLKNSDNKNAGNATSQTSVQICQT